MRGPLLLLRMRAHPRRLLLAHPRRLLLLRMRARGRLLRRRPAQPNNSGRLGVGRAAGTVCRGVNLEKGEVLAVCACPEPASRTLPQQHIMGSQWPWTCLVKCAPPPWLGAERMTAAGAADAMPLRKEKRHSPRKSAAYMMVSSSPFPAERVAFAITDGCNVPGSSGQLPTPHLGSLSVLL